MRELNPFAIWLKTEREKRGATRGDLSLAMRWHGDIKKWEEWYTLPNAGSVCRIATALNVSLATVIAMRDEGCEWRREHTNSRPAYLSLQAARNTQKWMDDHPGHACNKPNWPLKPSLPPSKTSDEPREVLIHRGNVETGTLHVIRLPDDVLEAVMRLPKQLGSIERRLGTLEEEVAEVPIDYTTMQEKALNDLRDTMAELREKGPGGSVVYTPNGHALQLRPGEEQVEGYINGKTLICKMTSLGLGDQLPKFLRILSLALKETDLAMAEPREPA